jgi:hypothetical protein
MPLQDRMIPTTNNYFAVETDSHNYCPSQLKQTRTPNEIAHRTLCAIGFIPLI